MRTHKWHELGAVLVPQIATCVCLALVPGAVCSAHEPTVPRELEDGLRGADAVELAGPVDVAANSFKMLAAEYKIGTQQPRFEFSDGQQSGYSSQYYMGYVLVSHPLKTGERQALLDAAEANQRFAKTYSRRKKRADDGAQLVFERFDVSPKEGYAYAVSGDMDITIAFDRIVVSAASHDHSGDAQRVRNDFAMKSSGLALRPVGELLSAAGVCFPYVFIKDDDQQRRAIGVTYRLQNHPDVTIWLEDSSANAPTPEQNADKFTADYRANFFWSQRYQDRSTLKLLSRKHTDRLMDGRKGVATLVEILRLDGVTTDFGYLAVVRGDPDAKQDTPDLMLYVIRDAKNATTKGKQPIDKDEFIKMAQTIAASVKRRPTQ